MFIRSATASDAHLLTSLSAVTTREAFGPPHNSAQLVEEYIRSAFTLPRTEAELADARSTFFLLETGDGTPVGYAKMHHHAPPRQMPKPYRRVGTAIEIERIYLLNEHVGRGQGQRLMNHCLGWARARGYAATWLGVWERNERALAFYQKMGFVRFGFHYFQFGSERQRDFWLLKSLSI